MLTIEQSMSRLKINLVRKRPFYGVILMKLNDMKESNTTNIMSTDGENIYYNKKYMEQLNEAERNFYLLHQLYHCIFMHPSRMINKDIKIANIAADFLVNYYIDMEKNEFKKAGIIINIPKDAYMIKNENDRKSLDKLSFEQLYEIIYNKQKSKIQASLHKNHISKENNSTLSIYGNNINLNKINNVEELKGIIIGLRQCMKRLNVVLGEDNNIKELEDYIDSVIDNHKDIQASRIHAIQILNSLEILKVALTELRVLGKENYNNIKFTETDYPTQLQSINKKRFIMNSVKLSFAIRSAIGISLAAFVSDYFNLSEGRWIIFTMVSLVVPIYEASIKKAKDRFIATIIGAVIIVILFSIFKSVGIRSMILIGAGYVNSYLKEYKHKTICTTVSAIGSAALLGNTTVLTLRRIIFVAIGVVLAIIINRFILPRKIEDYTRELEGMYLEAVKAMLKKVYLSPTENNMHGMNNLFIITSLIESRLENNKEFLNKRAIKSISQNRLLILNIHELYILFSNDKFKNIDSKYIVEDMKMITSFTDQNIKELLDKIEDHIKKSDNIYNKMMLENIREVYKEIYKINKYVS